MHICDNVIEISGQDCNVCLSPVGYLVVLVGAFFMVERSVFKPFDGCIVVTHAKALQTNFLCYATLLVVQILYTTSAVPVTSQPVETQQCSKGKECTTFLCWLFLRI